MNFKKFFLFVLILNSFHLFASAPVYVNYKTSEVGINQFLCFSSEFDKEIVPEQNEVYLDLEKKFYDFCYFTEALIYVHNVTGKKIFFYSQIDGSVLTVDSKEYCFAPKSKEGEDEYKDCCFTDEFNNPYFIVQYLCKLCGQKVPEIKIENKNFYLLEVESKMDLEFSEFDDADLMFFYPDGEIFYSPCFEISKKNYIGFYYSKTDATAMKKLLKEKYGINSKIKNVPLSFSLINKAYFKISF